MVTVMSKTVAMMAVRNGGDALGYGDDDGNDATAVRLMTAMMAMTLWKRTFPYLHACRYGKGSGDTAKRNKLATLGSSSTVRDTCDVQKHTMICRFPGILCVKKQYAEGCRTSSGRHQGSRESSIHIE